MLGKFLAWYLTGSNAVLTDALESIVNVVAGAVSLYGLVLASRPRDTNHPYGHGKVEFLSATLEGSLIVLAGLVIIAKAIYNMYYPIAIQSLDLGIVIVAVAGAVNYIIGTISLRRGRSKSSIVLTSGGHHLRSDAYSTVGLVLGLVIIMFTGWYWLDNIVAIIFGSIIAYTGYKVLRESIAGIMDESDAVLVTEIVETLDQHRGAAWVDFHNLRVIKYGSTLHIDCHFTVPWYYNVNEAHAEAEAVEELIDREIGRSVEMFIHIDPCVPASCPLCIKGDCLVRQQPFRGRLPWNIDTVRRNEKHGLDND